MKSGNEATVNAISPREQATHPATARGHSDDEHTNSTYNEPLTTSLQFDGHATVNTKSSTKKPPPSKQLRGSKSQAPVTSVRYSPHLRQARENSGSITLHEPPSSREMGPKTLQLPFHHSCQRPSSMAQTRLSMNSRVPDPARSFNVSRRNDWSNWLELGVDFRGFPPKVTTKDVWKVLKGEGEILTIELFDDDKGDLSGRGRVRFRYALDFWRVDDSQRCELTQTL